MCSVDLGQRTCWSLEAAGSDKDDWRTVRRGPAIPQFMSACLVVNLTRRNYCCRRLRLASIGGDRCRLTSPLTAIALSTCCSTVHTVVPVQPTAALFLQFRCCLLCIFSVRKYNEQMEDSSAHKCCFIIIMSITVKAKWLTKVILIT